MKRYIKSCESGLTLLLLLLAGALIVPPITVRGETTPACEPVCAAETASSNACHASKDLAAAWGIEVAALRLSGDGNFIDFRYRVTDPAKAAPLASVKFKPALIHQATGAALHVPSMPKVGQLRATTSRLAAGKVYIALFSNPGKVVRKGDKVTIRIGDFHAEDLTVGS